MKKNLVILLLLAFILSADAQSSVSFTRIEKGKPCDSCVVSGSYNQNPILNFSILDGIDEFVHQQDDLYLQSGAGLERVVKFFTSSAVFSLNFLPMQSAAKEPLLPPAGNRNTVSYKELEFEVSQNNSVLQGWRAVASLQPEKNYRISYSDESTLGRKKEWLSFQAGVYKLNIGDSLLIRIRKINTSPVLQNIYIRRIKTLPEISGIRQFSSGTSIQDILNKEINRENSWIMNGNELEVEADNSLLLNFNRPVNGEKIIEYSFSDTPGSWQKIQLLNNNIPTISPYYLFIEKPAAVKVTDLYIRYQHQPESVRHIKILVKPRFTQTTFFKIAASIALAFLLFIISYYFNRRKNKRHLQKLLWKKKDLENKIQLLSGQLNPYFLFNTLNSIQNLVHKNKTDEAGEYISRVASFLRTVMTIGKKEYISLQEELDIAESYLQLEQNRKFFHYEIINQCEIDFREIDFPPLLLQPVLENSIHHGFTNMTDPRLVIRILCKEKNIFISISDNGSGYDHVLVKKGHGLDLVEKRIQVMNENQPGSIQLQVSSSAEGQTITTFILKEWI